VPFEEKFIEYWAFARSIENKIEGLIQKGELSVLDAYLSVQWYGIARKAYH
jgi:hypothetical protein